MAGGNNCHAPFCGFGQGGFCISGLFPTGTGDQQDCTTYGGDPNFSCNCQCCPPCYPCNPCSTEFTYEFQFTNTNPPGVDCTSAVGTTTKFTPKITTSGCCMVHLCFGCDKDGYYPPVDPPYGYYSATDCCPRTAAYGGPLSGQAIIAVGGGSITISPGGIKIPHCKMNGQVNDCFIRFVIIVRDQSFNGVETLFAPDDGSDFTFDIDECYSFELRYETSSVFGGFTDACPCCTVTYPNCGPCKSSKMLCVVQAAQMRAYKKAMLKRSVLSRIKKVHYKP